MKNLFSPGDIIYGYCNGAFGRDDYDTKTCIFVNNNYAVFQNDEGYGTILNKQDKKWLTIESVEGWKIQEEYNNDD